MPIYVFECKNCGKVKEEYFSSNDLTNAPECCKVSMRKIPANTSFQLKGKGWAKDGYQK